MHFLFAALRLYPAWALPLAFVLVEVGIYFRRRQNSLQFPLFGTALFFVLTSVLWIVFRGDLNSDQWMRYMLGLS